MDLKLFVNRYINLPNIYSCFIWVTPYLAPFFNKFVELIDHGPRHVFVLFLHKGQMLIKFYSLFIIGLAGIIKTHIVSLMHLKYTMK